MPLDRWFDFVITYEDGLVIDKECSPKLLSKIYAMYDDYTEENTFIVDDSAHTYRCNVKNAIPIDSFCYNSNDDDDDLDNEFLRIMNVHA